MEFKAQAGVKTLSTAPVGEPPPTAPEEETLIDVLCDNLATSHMNDGIRANIKPKIASLILDNPTQHQCFNKCTYSDIDNLPIQVTDSEKFVYNINNSNTTREQPLEETDIDLIGAIIDDDEMNLDSIADDDPVTQSLRESQAILNQAWTPSLNTVYEETSIDLKIEQDQPIIKQTDHVSTKRLRGRRYRDSKLRDRYENKINSAIKKNGIHRVKLATAQNDSGANRSVTNQRNLLVHFKSIKPYAINGVKEGSPAIYCTGIGLLPWRADTGEVLLIKCLYCDQASGTIISPSDVNMQYREKYDGWTLETKYDSKYGQLTFNARDGINHLVFSAYSDNNLWHHYLDEVTEKDYSKLGSQTKAIVNSLSVNAQYHIWHHRLGHPCNKIMMEAQKHCIGIPKLKLPQFFSCNTCNSSKFRKTHIGPTKSVPPKSDTPQEYIEVGQHLHLDFGFVRGSDYSRKDDDGRLVTSVDGYRSYCLVIDRASRYITVILTKTKKPPIDELRHIFKQFRSNVKSNHCTVTTDLGGELAKSKSFIKLLTEENVQYIPRTTAAFSSAQNGLAEKPNQDLARMMRSLLYGAGLGSQYWSYALRHAVYLKNRLPHTSLHYITPYEKVNKMKPDMSNLRVFGSRVHFMHSNRQKKLDKMDNTGTFVAYKGSDKLAYVIDDTTGKERVTSHLTFDEAHTSVSAEKQPPMAIALQQSGFQPNKEEVCRIKVKLLTKSAKVPQRGSEQAAGFDLYAKEKTIVKANSQQIIGTGIALEMEPGYHAQISVRSSFATKYKARVEAGLIDSDYRGEVFVIMSNNGDENINIDKGERMAQLCIVKDPSVIITVSHDISSTKRGDGKFGSTGKTSISPNNFASTTASAATIHSIKDTQSHHQIELSTSPYFDTQEISMTTLGKHPTQGLILKECEEYKDRVIISSCKPGTAAAKISNWAKRLKHNILLEVDGTPVKSIQQAQEILHNKSRGTTVQLTIGVMDKVPMHDDSGIPMLYFDQLHVISQHLQHIKNNDMEERLQPPNKQSYPSSKLAKAIKRLDIPGMIAALHGILPKNKMKSKRLTRKKLQNSQQWDKWKSAEWKQLDQYWDQKMFGKPCPLPPNANVLNLLWDYRIKDDGTYKARMVCNGRPSNKNTVVFGYTYAKSLDHVGARIFWAAAAAKNLIVQGADASNAFAEADAPKHPLYVRVNEPYRQWWTQHLQQPPIPPGYVLPVFKALQGHPEAPRAWATKIDEILQKQLKLKPTTHEPCLYHGYHKGKEILFLRQVDDFAVAAETSELATEVIDTIDKYMTIKIKDLGRLTRYNGVDVIQARNYIKINNPTYITKIVNEHAWMIEGPPLSTLPTPMKDDKKFIHQMETAVPPSCEEDRTKLQIDMNFNYRQAIGELIFAMVTCRPDISFPLIKLSQYSANPARVHYEAVIEIFKYLHATKDEGITYWRETPNMSLPDLPLPTVHKDNYSPTSIKQEHEPTTLTSAVDADWAGDTTHRKSVSGIVIKLAGGSILYKTKYQDTIALSTTEAEFTAASDAGKSILYVRSILDQINLPQDKATILHIDNNGALLMGNAQQPTRRTRHMDLRKFSLIEWIKRDLILMQRISTSDNCADVLTKQTGRQLFYRHYDYIMGRVIPTYVKALHNITQVNTINALEYSQHLGCEDGLFSSSVQDFVFEEHGGDIMTTRIKRVEYPHNN